MAQRIYSVGALDLAGIWLGL